MSNPTTSFDVFETVVARVTGSPNSAFLLLGKHLLSNGLITCSAEAFSHQRLFAERRARANQGPSMKLSHIYHELCLSLFSDRPNHSTVKRLQEQEEAFQESLLRRIECNALYLENLREKGGNIIFTSDMHLSPDFIRKQLIKHQIWNDKDELFVSSHYGKTKASGKLFEEILNTKKLSPNDLSHIGDSKNGDYDSPQNLGIKSEWFSEGLLNRYEQIMESYSSSTDGFSSLMAGASRLARLACEKQPTRIQTIRTVSAGVVAPALTSFILWILKSASARNIKTLYFLSRDGQILYDIANEIVDKTNLSIQLKYLYGSRLAWNRATTETIKEHWIWNPLLKQCTLKLLFDRIELSYDEVKDHLSKIGFEKKDWNRTLSNKEVESLKLKLANSEVEQLLVLKSKSKLATLNKYFHEEGLFSSEKKAIIDLGWAGSMFSSLNRILNKEAISALTGFYFGKNRSESIDNECKAIDSYFFDERYSTGIHRNYIKDALELFCTADHGTVLTFTECKNRVSPVFEKEKNEDATKWGLPILRETVSQFINYLVIDQNISNPYIDTRECIGKLLEAFIKHPQRHEGEVWGQLPWENHLNEKDNTPLKWSRKLSIKDVFHAFIQRRVPKAHLSEWSEGSIAQTSPTVLFFLKAALKIRRTLSS